MNERELRVLRQIADALRALQNEICAKHTKQESQDDTHENQIVRPLRVEIVRAPDLDQATRDYYEAEKQERHSRWRHVKPWVETIGVVVAIVLGVFNLLTLLEIRKQTPSIAISAAAAKEASQTSAHQLEAAERPWIKLTPTHVGPIFLDPNGLNVVLDFILSNSGHSPAVNVTIEPEIYMSNIKKPDPIAERERICNQLLARKSLGETIFPGDSKRERYTFGTTGQEVERAVHDYHGMLPALIVTCVGYAPTFMGNRRYATGVIYSLEKMGTNGSPVVIRASDISPALKPIIVESPFYGVLTAQSGSKQ
jgi:hypothetical protein